MKKLKNTLESSYLYFYFIFLFLLILSFSYPFFLIFLFAYFLYIRKRINLKILLSLIIITIILLIFAKYLEKPYFVSGNYKVIEVKETSINTYQIIIKKGFRKYLIYYQEQLKPGEIINVRGTYKSFDYYLTPFSFNFDKYYKSNGIYGKITNLTITKTNDFNYLYVFSNIIKNDYLKMFFTSFKIEDINQTFMELNIYYLISLSGLHINFLVKIAKKIMFHLNTKTKKQEKIELTIYLICLLLSSYKTIIFRIFVYQLLKYIKKQKEIQITNYSLMNLSFFLLLFLRPNLLFNKSYLVSYLLVTSIHLFTELVDSSNNLIKLIKFNILSNIILLPFFNTFNLISIVLSPVYFFIIIYLIFPLSIITNFTNSYLIDKIIRYLFLIIDKTNKLNFNVSIYNLNYLLIFLYFVILILILVSKKSYKKNLSFLLLFLIILPKYYRYFNNGLYILDSGQGDTSVFISNNKTVVIDAYKNTESFLKGFGIKQIDYLILSHSHTDHILEANTLITEFKVLNVITSYYDSNYNLNINTLKVKSDYFISESDFNIKFLGPTKDFNDENNNSLVFSFNFNQTSILFTGDIEYEAELNLITHYKNELSHDYLKVAHHGSKTSSNIKFLEAVNPSAALISCGKNNIYRFPHQEVLNNLSQLRIKTYITKEFGTIKIIDKDNIKYYY